MRSRCSSPRVDLLLASSSSPSFVAPLLLLLLSPRDDGARLCLPRRDDIASKRFGRFSSSLRGKKSSQNLLPIRNDLFFTFFLCGFFFLLSSVFFLCVAVVVVVVVNSKSSFRSDAGSSRVPYLQKRTSRRQAFSLLFIWGKGRSLFFFFPFFCKPKPKHFFIQEKDLYVV